MNKLLILLVLIISLVFGFSKINIAQAQVTDINDNCAEYDASQASGETPLVLKYNTPLPNSAKEETITSLSLGKYLNNLYRFGLGLIGLIALLMMTIGGLQWLFAGGNSSKVSSAKETILGAVVGLIIGLGAYTILNLINPELLKVRPVSPCLMKKLPADPIADLARLNVKVKNCKDIVAPSGKVVKFQDKRKADLKQETSLQEGNAITCGSYYYFFSNDTQASGVCENNICGAGEKCIQKLDVNRSNAEFINSCIKTSEITHKFAQQQCNGTANEKFKKGDRLACQEWQEILINKHADLANQGSCNLIGSGQLQDEGCRWCPVELFEAIKAMSADKVNSWKKDDCRGNLNCADLELGDIDRFLTYATGLRQWTNKGCFVNLEAFLAKYPDLRLFDGRIDLEKFDYYADACASMVCAAVQNAGGSCSYTKIDYQCH